MKRPVVSIIICTYNRQLSLRRTLYSLFEQSFSSDDFEIIVVNDGSTDSTADLCIRLKKNFSNLEVVTTWRNQGLAAAANIGMKTSKGNYLLFTDDDCIADKNWVTGMTGALTSHPIVAGMIGTYSRNYFQLCHNISQFHPFMPGHKSGEKDYIAGANMGFQRRVFAKLGGFKEGHPTPDMEFIIRARMQGFRVFFEPSAGIIHDPDRLCLSEILSYSYQHAKTTILLRNTYAGFLKTSFVLRSPILLALCAPVISLKVLMDIYLKNIAQFKFLETIPTMYGLKLA